MKVRLMAIAVMAAALALGACGKEKTEQGSGAPGAAKQDQATQGAQPSGQAAQPAPPGQDQPTGATAGGTGDANMAKARQIFASQCSLCHGPEGRGNGPAAANMNPGPRDYGSKEWQQTVTDERIAEVIIKGGQGTGLNPMMPANPMLASQPEVVDALVKLIRSFATE
jgi:mono/diheme cytochrome c family protein